MEQNNIRTLQAKVCISGDLKILTGMHIGGGGNTSAIGAVDSPIIRDSLTKCPVIPGSSIKGKMRTLLAKLYDKRGIGVLGEPDKDDEVVKRLFGSSEPIQPARLQFFDLSMQEESKESIEKMDTDLYLTEVKFENTINRLTAQANPRQIERVPAGAVFSFKLIYNLESMAEYEEDIKGLQQAILLLEDDYIGSHGSRGYGRIEIDNLQVDIPIKRDDVSIDKEKIAAILKGGR
ncbi:type III-A CRISPR-associated RAMP protein Csm3 [Pectinatus sottacetonis]|uniref:type III-A CRISPR-associated RAMP protein Csm3 n=1 Tax=Pectinatus sottacetonis TaxID=1002795 RepID=UPI0018C503C3|nr:type III-A CRISPR-associated RAMP protein Csm3 [Pectinatus sottacetonis]